MKSVFLFVVTLCFSFPASAALVGLTCYSGGTVVYKGPFIIDTTNLNDVRVNRAPKLVVVGFGYKIVPTIFVFTGRTTETDVRNFSGSTEFTPELLHCSGIRKLTAGATYSATLICESAEIIPITTPLEGVRHTHQGDCVIVGAKQ